MNPVDREQLVDVLTGVHDFYRQDMSDFAMGVWLKACEGFEVEQVSSALSAHLMDPERGQFMPKPADLVRILQGTQTDRALVAWGKVLDAAQRVGAYASVTFDDGVIHAVIEDLGGWQTVCRGEIDELPHLQRRFCDSYRAYARRPDVRYPGRLAGDHELSNAMNGYQVEPPMLIGDPAKALQIQASGVSGPKTQITTTAQALRLAHPAQRQIAGTKAKP